MRFNNHKHVFAILPFALFITLITFNSATAQNPKWKVPEDAKKVINPLKGVESATKAGKKLFAKYCSVCHGAKGKGDGIASGSLSPKPANLDSEMVQAHTDGGLYWKMTEGKPPMAAYKNILSDEQRWELVNFIRTFKKEGK